MGHKKRGLPPATPFIRPPRFDMPVALLLSMLIVACLVAFMVAPTKHVAPKVVAVPQPYPVYIIKPSSGGAHVERRHVARYHSHHRG